MEYRGLAFCGDGGAGAVRSDRCRGELDGAVVARVACVLLPLREAREG